MSELQSILVANGDRMPSVGLGLWKIDNNVTSDMVVAAIEAGYRHLDAACDYGNEREAGKGIRIALDRGLCRRDELWVTSKLWNTYHRRQHVRPALERSLKDLGLDYLDLYLIHFPIHLRYVDFDQRYPPGWFHDPSADLPHMEVESLPMAETWGAMEALQIAGLTRHIGVSNFNCSLLRDLLSYATVRPSVLQVESHPYLVQQKLLRYCQQESVAYTAFSPLGAGSYVPLGMATSHDSVLEHATVRQIAEQAGRTPAQVVLRWAVQRGTAVIPKTAHLQRLKENIALFDFELSGGQMELITALDQHRRFNDPGVFCEQAFGTFYPIFE